MLNLEGIRERIEEKKENYREYGFTHEEDLALKTFYDLAQELDSQQELFLLCVAIPLSFFGLHSRLYLKNPRDESFMLVTASEEDKVRSTPPPMPDGPYIYNGDESMVVRVRGKEILLKQLPFECPNGVIGLLEIYPVTNFTPHDELFFVKYANRLGFNLHNRFLVDKNIEHLRFISSLVADIEHNIIAPNIIYKLYLKNLTLAVSRNAKVEKRLAELSAQESPDVENLKALLADMSEVNTSLTNELDEISKHHRNMSLFLETLLRRSHFDQGRLTLKRKKCNMKFNVVDPQLERYAERFRSMNIAVDYQSSGLPEDEIVSVVDVGLMSQVYANFFSNALKYTQEVVTRNGQTIKYVSYGYQIIKDYFGTGRDGQKYNVFTTGPHLKEEERLRIFEDQYRGSNIGTKPGSGHGLSFVKNVVEIHGGIVGYEATQYGNNFYFILPKA